MKINKYDFEEIQNRIDAARSLQNGGQTDDCTMVLEKLAREILEKGNRDD